VQTGLRPLEGIPPPQSWARGGDTLIGRLCLSSSLPLPAPCSAETSHPTSYPHNTFACHHTSLPPPPRQHPAPHNHLCFGYKQPVPGAPLGFVSAAAKDRATLHIPSRLGKVYKRALVVPPSSPHQTAFVCGACTCTAQVGVSLVSLLKYLFEANNTPCVFSCITALSEVQPLVFKHRNIGER